MKKLVLTLMLLGAASHAATTNQTTEATIPVEEYPYRPPFLGQKAIDAGEEIPLPLGVSAAYYHVTRDIDVKSISASINDKPLQSVDDLLKIDVITHVNTGTLRLDAWILPFLNVYGLVGGIDNTSEINANFDIGGTNYNIRADGSFSGTATGFGTVLAGGYINYFMTLDANWIYSDLGDQFDTRFSGQIYNARFGWKGKIKNHNTCIWLGAVDCKSNCPKLENEEPHARMNPFSIDQNKGKEHRHEAN